MSEIDSGEQLRQVTLSGAGELCLVTHPRIEVARGPPERGEGTAVPGEIPYTRGDQTTRSGDPRHLPQPPHWISHEVHDQLGKREVETVIGEGKMFGCTAANVNRRQARPDCSHERGGGIDRRDCVGAQPVHQLRRQGSRPAAHIQRPLTLSHAGPLHELHGNGSENRPMNRV